MPDDLEPSTPARLRELANAASSGPWRTEWSFQDYNVISDDRGADDPILTMTFAVATWEPEATEERAECDTADADLIATVASPPVVLVLADLLEAIRDYRPNHDGTIFDIEAKADALDAALSTQDDGGGRG